MAWLAGSRAAPTAADLRGVASFNAVFAEVEAGRAVFGVVPIEHSSSGSLHQVYDCLLKSPLCIVGELGMVEEHCLVRGARLSAPGPLALDSVQARALFHAPNPPPPSSNVFVCVCFF